MKKHLFLVAFFVICSVAGKAAVSPGLSYSSLPSLNSPVDPLKYFSSLTMKQVERLAGRKLKLKEKIAVKILQWKLRKGVYKKGEPVRGKGHTAKILGIIALSALIVPVIGPFASLVCAILALILGYSALKVNPDDRQAKSGILMGWITIGLMVLALILVIAILSSMAWGWGWG